MGLNYILAFAFLAVVPFFDTVVLRALGLSFLFGRGSESIQPASRLAIFLSVMVLLPAMLTLAVCLSPSTPDASNVLVGALGMCFLFALRRLLHFMRFARGDEQWKS